MSFLLYPSDMQHYYWHSVILVTDKKTCLVYYTEGSPPWGGREQRKENVLPSH
jgi:hypothetical protein